MGLPPPISVRKFKDKKKSAVGGKWTFEEDTRLREVVNEYGPKNWKVISKVAFNGTRSDVQCLHRWQKVLKPGLVKGPWLQREDEIILSMIRSHGIGNIKWSEIAAALPGRLGKQCRERWVNHLDPDLKKDAWTEEEDRILMTKQVELGNKWRDIAAFLPGRSENSVKNRWNSAKRKHIKEDEATFPQKVKSKRLNSNPAYTSSLKKPKNKKENSHGHNSSSPPSNLFFNTPGGSVIGSSSPTFGDFDLMFRDKAVSGIGSHGIERLGAISPGLFQNSEFPSFTNNNFLGGLSGFGPSDYDFLNRSSCTSPLVSSILDMQLLNQSRVIVGNQEPSPTISQKSPVLQQLEEMIGQKNQTKNQNSPGFNGDASEGWNLNQDNGLVIIGTKLTEKQKQMLKDDPEKTDLAASSFFKSGENQQKLNPSGQTGEHEDIFGIFTFDDLVDDLVS